MIKFIHFNNTIPKHLSQRLQRKYQSRTLAVETADPADIRALARDFVDTRPADQMLIYKLRIGSSFLHPQDKYVKSEGRDKSSANMEDIPVTVLGVKVTPTHIFIRLETVLGVDLNLRLNKATNFSTVMGRMPGVADCGLD
jgi:hypothetical protein